MIKAIVFDCFGVLTSEGWLNFMKNHFSNDPEAHKQARTLNQITDSGVATYATFISGVARLAGITEQQTASEIEEHIANDQLFDYIRNDLVSHYKIGMLSNVGVNRLDTMFTPDQLSVFDAVALSVEIGVIKPDPRAYQIIAEKLGVATNECVFIDDQLRFCEGAIAAGMQAIHYSDLSQLQTELKTLLAE